jgi:hypothetical protein
MNVDGQVLVAGHELAGLEAIARDLDSAGHAGRATKGASALKLA